MSTWRASSFGSCTRALVAEAIGKTPVATPDWQQAIYDKGNVHEPLCVEAMHADGWVFMEPDRGDWDAGQIYVELAVGDSKITGHLDGVASHWEGDQADKVIEIKNPAAWAKFEKAYKTGDWSDPLCHRYAWQLSVYQVATGLEAVVACVEDGRVKTFGVEVPPFSLDDIRVKVQHLEIHVAKEQLPATCSQRDSFCPWPYLHDDEPEVVEDDYLDSLAETYLLCAEREKAASEAKKEAYGLLMAHGGGFTANHKVSVYEQAGRKTLDEKQMRADGIDVDKYRTEGRPSQRVKITRRDLDPFAE
jgi:hypothetical protein